MMLVLLCGPLCFAADPPGEDFWALPRGTIAFFALDPGVLGDGSGSDPNRAAVDAGVRALVGNILRVEGGGAGSALGLVRAEVLRDAPYRMALLELEVESGPEPAPGKPVRLSQLAAVIEVRGTAQAAALEAALLAGAPADSKVADVALARGIKARRLETGGDRSPVSWAQVDERFCVGIGDGALELWLGAEPEAGAWNAHRREWAKVRGNARVFLEAFVDLDLLRESAPDEVGWGTIGELMHRGRISNARGLMVHGSAGEEDSAGVRLLQVHLSWANRTEPPGKVRAGAITAGAWPAALGKFPEGTRYAVALPADWNSWIALGMWGYALLAPKDTTFMERAGPWMRGKGSAIERLTRASSGLVGIVGPGQSVRGAAVLVPYPPGRAIDGPREDLLDMLRSLEPTVAYARQGRVWTLNTRASETSLRYFFVTAVRDGFVGAWSIEQLPAPTAKITPER
jgi:hypothetical protein